MPDLGSEVKGGLMAVLCEMHVIGVDRYLRYVIGVSVVPLSLPTEQQEVETDQPATDT